MAYTPTDNPYIPGDPYSYDLKWIVSEVKHAIELYEPLSDDFDQLYNYVHDYFDNLDISAELRAVLYQMDADGTLRAIIQPILDDYTAGIDNDINVLIARMDTFASLPAGSTAGNAELLDIRVSSSGYTYPSAGDAVRAQVNIDDNASKSATFKNYEPEYSFITGSCIAASDLSILSIATYEMTTPILVRPKELITCFATASNGIAIMALCDPDGTPTQLINVGSSDVSERVASYLNTSTSDQYVICSGGIAQGLTILTYCDHIDPEASLDNYHIQSLYYRNDGTAQPIAILNTWKCATYVCSTPIRLRSGETIHLMGNVSSSIPAIIICDEYGDNRTNARIGTGVNFYNYTADADCYVMVQYYNDVTYTLVSYSHDWNSNYDNNDTRHPVVTFIFDDGVIEDSDVFDVFEEKHFKCGFALVSTIATSTTGLPKIHNYLKWQKLGYSMLSHSTDGTGMNDPSENPTVIQNKLLTAKSRLEEAGFDIKGWVTPSSTMNDIFKPLVPPVYDYAYTIYYGAYDPANPSYNTFDEGSYNLWRLDLMNRLSDLEAAVDSAIANNGLLTIYCHAAQMQPTHFQLLRDILDYIRAYVDNFQLKCLPPDEAYQYYYNVRKEDLS